MPASLRKLTIWKKTMKASDLIKLAAEARKKAYADYSGYKVGAAILGKNGKVYTGCNVENAVFPAGICAERNAIFSAVADGTREFSKIAIVGGSGEKVTGYAYPCGICRQVMREFTDPATFKIIVARSAKDYKEYTLFMSTVAHDHKSMDPDSFLEKYKESK